MHRPPRASQRFFLLILVGLSGCGSAMIDRPEDHSPEDQARHNQTDTERLRFDHIDADWRTLVGQLAALDLQYHTASARRRDELRKQYDHLVSEGTAAQQQVVQAAVTAYARAPEENADLATLLTGVAFLVFNQEEYEEALRLAQILIDQGVSHGELYALAGRAAFVVGEFDLADKHLRHAKKQPTMLGTATRDLQEIDYYKAAWEKEKRLRLAEDAAGDLPRVLLTTTQGEIELQLFENEAPNTVANFIWLVEQGYYNGLTFHRVISQAMAQAGCPKGDGTGGPGYAIPCECYREDHRLHFRGTLAMAHSGRNTGGSQFYLTFTPARQLDGNHTVFGRIVRGIDTLAQLQRREPQDPVALKINPHSNFTIPPADRIIMAKVLRKRNHPYTPKVFHTSKSADGHRAARS